VVNPSVRLPSSLLVAWPPEKIDLEPGENMSGKPFRQKKMGETPIFHCWWSLVGQRNYA
jgi:hypothetical protein